MTLYEPEVEIAPGIYLTKKADPATVALAQSAARMEMERKAMEALEANPKAYLEWLGHQAMRLENSLEKLEYSNREMMLADAEDAVFKEAVQENLVVMQRQRLQVVDYKKKMTEISRQLGVCLTASSQGQIAQVSLAHDIPDEEAGMYL
ncbi:hypothetical protein HDV03_000177 [Kappamyces sp. JEL0829]|nr:hypothetical protein HDV03_000177 [Kappamyces sp. JEL0829]